MTTTFRVLAVDVMDTVVRDPYREALEAATGRPLRELFRLRDRNAYPRLERGEITEAAYWQVYAEADIAIEPAVFHHVRLAGYRWLPGMRELLTGLAGEIHRVTATNYPRWIGDLGPTLLAGCFDEVVGSVDLGVRKPDPAFFERLADRLGVAPADVLFVDDREDNLAGARAAGVEAVLAGDPDEIRARLGLRT